MSSNQKVFKIFGPPGTGKTTYFLSVLEELLEVYKPDEIAFVSFTRKGAYEGRDRASAKFNIPKSHMPYFKTLHALCFKFLNLKRSSVMSPQDYRTFSKKSGYFVIGRYTYEFLREDDKYLFALQLAKNNKEAFTKFIEDMNPDKLLDMNDALEAYKLDENVIDYSDMLLRYVRDGRPIPVKVAFIDEAQDLTPLQYAVINRMFKKCEALYFAGDDDQAIYDWAGADVRKFIEFPAKTKVLSLSYRLPAIVKRFSDKILENILYRANKKFEPRDEEGILTIAESWGDIDFCQSNDMLVLARNKRLLTPAIKEARRQGILYLYDDEPSVDKKVLSAIDAFNQYQKTPNSETEHRLKLYKHLFETLDTSGDATMQLDLPEEERFYYKSIMAKSSGSVEFKPTVRFNTIHTAKGTEADTVVLCNEMSRQTYEHFRKDPDSEWRCFYVGATRARRKLILKQAKTNLYYPIIGEIDVLD